MSGKDMSAPDMATEIQRLRREAKQLTKDLKFEYDRAEWQQEQRIDLQAEIARWKDLFGLLRTRKGAIVAGLRMAEQTIHRLRKEKAALEKANAELLAGSGEIS